MPSQRMEIFIGTMIIGIVAGVFVMTILFGSERGFFIGGGGRRMTILFERGGGIGQNSVVLKNGIKIGRVYSVDLVDDKAKAEVRVAFELDPTAKIYSNEYAKINRTFLGDASIEFVKNPDFKGEIVEIDGATAIRGVPGGDLMGTVSNIEGDLAKAIQNVNQAAQGLTLFMSNLNSFLGDEDELNQKKQRLQAVFTELNDTLVSIKTLATHMDSVVSDEQLNANIRDAATKVPQILERVDELMASANSLTGDVRQTMDRAETTFDLVDKNLDNVNVFTTALAEQGPETMTALNATAADVKTMVRHIATLAEDLAAQVENPETPLGMLSDKETAQSLRRIVRNAEELTQKAYPILDDARVFSNKIAHRPSSLIWDKNTYKGAPENGGRYGMQSKSPTGGVSSPLYRRTPSGAKVCERPDRYYRYRPNADVDFMDVEARIAYENEYPDAARKNARPSSLTKLWNKIFRKNDGGVFSTYDSSTATESFGGAYPVEASVCPTAYSAVYSSNGSVPNANVENAAYSDFNRGFANRGVSTANVSGRAASARPFVLSTESTQREQTTPPTRPLESVPTAPYSELGRTAAPLDFQLADDSAAEATASTAIEELPSAVVRGAATSLANGTSPNALSNAARGSASRSTSGNAGAFEDDGLPIQFAPPTVR